MSASRLDPRLSLRSSWLLSWHQVLRQVLRQLAQRLQWRVSRSRLARLTIISQYYPPDFAATGQFIAELSRLLAERGLQNLVLTGQPSYAFQRQRAARIEFQPNRCVRRSATSRLWPERIRGRIINSLLFCLRTLVRLLRQGRRGDLLLFTTEPAYLPIIGWIAHLLTRAPYVLLLYDLYPDIAISLGVLAADHPLARLWQRLQGHALAAAREIIVLSSTMQQHLRHHYPQVHTRITVIPSWADPERIAPLGRPSNPFVQRHGLAQQFVVLYSGNQGRCHEFSTLLAAAEILRHQTSILFLIVGAGAQHAGLVQHVRRRRLQQVRFLPYQDALQLPALLAAADLAIVSLLAAAEGQVAPSKFYGHLAAACPVAAICAPHSYLRSELARGRCGRAFTCGDGRGLARFIGALAGNPARARRLGAAGRAYLQSSATPALIVQAYAEVLARHLPLAAKTYARPLLEPAAAPPKPATRHPASA
jgi:glycosyltransferase involved in cell wall biosynthesis